ncbi:hypothetical protein BGZ99_002021, partial [Dissophora globulifera]
LVTKQFFLTNQYLDPTKSIFKSVTLGRGKGGVFQEALSLLYEYFDYVVELIQYYSVFQRTSRKPQKEFDIQLKIAPHNFAHDRHQSNRSSHESNYSIGSQAKAITKALYVRKGSASFGTLIRSIDGNLVSSPRTDNGL